MNFCWKLLFSRLDKKYFQKFIFLASPEQEVFQAIGGVAYALLLTQCIGWVNYCSVVFGMVYSVSFEKIVESRCG